jgi:hypothetical protein
LYFFTRGFDHTYGVISGKHTPTQYILLCLPASLPSAWTAFNQVFVAAVPEHRCHVPDEHDEQAAIKLGEYLPMDGAVYSSCEQYAVRQVGGQTNTTRIPCQHGWVSA